ncbi:MAG: tetratricopeptide repeat protein [Candidatus Omnitrophica bacterium]|nr:tetratricopeptide repeat protein [Candidatus Omnitrophota bacterium]
MKSFYMKIFSVMIISCFGILIYSNSFICSFHFDDFPYITDNPAIRNIDNLQRIWNFWPCRFITFFSIALNYHFHQLDLFGYHLFNLTVHLVTALLVWWLTLLTLSTPAMKDNKISERANDIALLTGLVFVTHPLQTESVTYIWQRAASMGALFYLASLCLYIKSRLLLWPVGRAMTRLGALVIAIVAMFTKENTITLPFMILLYETTFLDNRSFKWKAIIPFLLTFIIVPLTMIYSKSINFQEMHRVTELSPNISPVSYLLTQFRVIVTYIRLIFLPFNLNLDYDYPVFTNIFAIPVLTSFLFLTAIILLAKSLFLKYRILSFSIFWFFLTLLPESSFIPIKDIIFEHRLYLPLAGGSIFLVSTAYYFLEKYSFKTVAFVLTMMIAVYSVLTYQRNKDWKDEIIMWEDIIQKSPHKSRPYNNRGIFYTIHGDIAHAMASFTKAIELNPRDDEAYSNLGVCYWQKGRFAQAFSYYNKAIEINPNCADAYENRGNLYKQQGNLNQAISDYTKAIVIKPNKMVLLNIRGNTYAAQGRFSEAIEDFTKAIEISPKNVDLFNNRGTAYAQQGRFIQAIIDYNRAADLNPSDRRAYYNLAVVFYHLNEYDKARANLNKAEKLGAPVDSELSRALKKVNLSGWGIGKIKVSL